MLLLPSDKVFQSDFQQCQVHPELNRLMSLKLLSDFFEETGKSCHFTAQGPLFRHFVSQKKTMWQERPMWKMI